jgi:nitrogenase molybdenum-cofactor synthesis protein NifE
MELYRQFPVPSDRMGTLWTLCSIEDAYIIEFGPAGTTHFAAEGMMQLNGEHKAHAYTTHISETDISLGSQDRLEKAVAEVDAVHHPKYIFVMASSISSVIGTDIESLCYELRPRTSAKLIPVTTGGYGGDHTLGIENTLLLCRQVVQPPAQKKARTYNLIGSNMDMFNFLSDAEEMKALLRETFEAAPQRYLRPTPP